MIDPTDWPLNGLLHEGVALTRNTKRVSLSAEVDCGQEGAVERELDPRNQKGARTCIQGTLELALWHRG